MRTAKFVLVLSLLLLATAAPASREVPFNIGLKANSAPVVGAEGVVTATVEVERDLPNVTIEIQPQGDGRVVGDSILVTGAVSKGSPVVFEAKVKFPTPGLKSVRVVAKCAEKPGVVWSDVAYVTLSVGETSSSVVTDTSSIRTPPRQTSKGSGKRIGRPAADKTAGKLVVSPDSAELQASPESDAGGEPASDLIISGKWSFVDRAGNTVGQRYQVVQLIKTLPYEMTIGTTHTDAEGNFVFDPVSYTSVGLYVRCLTSANDTNGSVYVIETPGSPFTSDTDVFSFDSAGHQSVGDWVVGPSDPNYKAWWIADDMIKACAVPPDSVGAHTVWFDPVYNGGAHYSEGGRIYLFANDVDDTPDTILHEMGHSVMYNIYGDYFPTTYCPDPHYLMGSSHVNCAWTEGWAQIWHMWTTNDPIRNYPGGGAVDLEAATWGDGYDEGRTVEGRVAGAVWDIADSANDGYDKYSGGWLDIWHIMYHHNCDKFGEFWDQWKAHNFNIHGAVASIYQNTIDWNTVPTFGGLPDVTIAEDEFRTAFNLEDYASDPESTDAQLIFELYYVSDPNLQIGINGLRQVSMQGVTNWNGTATVQVSCSDGIITQYDSFTVTVTPVNDPPVIKALPDISLDEDGSLYHATNLNLYTNDPETIAPSLIYTITGNTNPACGVTLHSSYYINVNPTADWSGTSDITVRATDPQGLWGEDTFTVTVNSVNDAPVITGLPDRTLDEDATLDNTIDLWAYASDVEIPASSLTYTIQSSELPEGTVTIDGNRYIDITPPANYNGSGNVTIRVWDWEEGYGEDTFLVTVNPVADPPMWQGIPDQTFQTTKVATSHDIDLYRYVVDPDGPDSELIFTVHRNTNPAFGASIYLGRYLRISHAAYDSGYTEITAKVTDPTGLNSSDKLNVVVGRLCDPCSEALGLADGAYVIFPAKPVTWSQYYAFYIGDDNRVSGIRVNYVSGPELDRFATIGGQMTTYEGERAVDCLSLVVGGTDTTPPQPLFTTHKSMGGVWPSANTPAVPTGRLGGLYNVGTLVRTTGTVVSRNTNSCWIADGSGVHYSFSNKGLYVDCQPITMYAPTRGSRVSVTGISGATTLLDGKVVNTLRLRSRDDIKGLGGRAVYIYSTAASTATVFAAMLAGQGWNTTIQSISSLLTADLSGYDLVIIGADTGTWTDTAKVNHIVDSDKPVIAMGSGGARFLDQVPDLYSGFANSASALLSQGYVSDLSSVLYWWDNIINVPTDGMLGLLTTTANTTYLTNPPAGVYGLLRHPTIATNWTVAQEGRFMQWGYDTLPSNMNQVAKDLLVNCLYYMQAK